MPVATLLFLVRVLSINYWTRDRFANLWNKYHTAFYHQQLHLGKAATFAPWIVTMVLCFAALFLGRRVEV